MVFLPPMHASADVCVSLHPLREKEEDYDYDYDYYGDDGDDDDRR